jgi:NAD(P)-dependent dehydrogenase (short-subunit alcohol dehydrogenase family)
VLQDKVVLITGGRRGIGAAFVDEALRRGARKVYSTAREPFDDPREAVVTKQLEVTDEDSVRALAAAAPDVEILVNNAGALFSAPLLTGDLDKVETTFAINVLGPLRLARAFAPILKAHDGGAIVNVCSVLSWLGGAGAYGASKAALWSLTNSLRVELRPQNTHVLGVHPAFVDTEMVSALSVPKSAPDSVATRVFAALENGENEVLTDDTAVRVKSILSGPVEDLVFPAARR